jgi:type II secretory pathway component PulF
MPQLTWPGFDARGRLSAEAAAELAAGVAELARAGLPLGDGLRALAAETAGRRLREVLLDLADRIDAGAELGAAFEAQGRRLPAYLRGLVAAGLRTGRLAETLEEYVELRRSRAELCHRLWQSLAYPFVLLVGLALVALVARYLLVEHFMRIFGDFRMALPAITEFVFAVSGPLAWGLVVLTALAGVAPFLLSIPPLMRWLWPVFYKIPMLGPMARWSHIAEFSRLTAVLLEQQAPLPDALRLGAEGMSNPGLARSCRQAADDVERGMTLAESLAYRGRFPPSIVPLVDWGQRNAALPDTLRAAGEMYEGRLQSQGSLLEAVLLPLMLMVIGVVTGVFILAMCMPLIRLITDLS